MSLGDWAENNALDWLTANGSPTRPTTHTLSLHTGDPGEDGTANESAATGYSRQAITFAAAASGVAASSNAQAFTTSDAAPGETITYVGIWDNAGNFLGGGALLASRSFYTGSGVNFGAGDINLTLD